MKKIDKISGMSSVLDIVNIRKQDFEISNFEIADMIVKIQDQIGENIENMKVIQNLIDHQFKLTSTFFLWWKWLYIVTFFIPFLYQSFRVRGTWDVVFCNVVCSISSLIQILIELW